MQNNDRITPEQRQEECIRLGLDKPLHIYKLDVTIQAQILELINNLRDKLDTAVILITHDLGVVANIADNVIVLYAEKGM